MYMPSTVSDQATVACRAEGGVPVGLICCQALPCVGESTFETCCEPSRARGNNKGPVMMFGLSSSFSTTFPKILSQIDCFHGTMCCSFLRKHARLVTCNYMLYGFFL